MPSDRATATGAAAAFGSSEGGKDKQPTCHESGAGQMWPKRVSFQEKRRKSERTVNDVDATSEEGDEIPVEERRVIDPSLRDMLR